jgi:hypothetical protein
MKLLRFKKILKVTINGINGQQSGRREVLIFNEKRQVRIIKT